MMTRKQRVIERTAWRPGAFILDGAGAALFFNHEVMNRTPEDRMRINAVHMTMTTIARALAAADKTLNSKKDQS